MLKKLVNSTLFIVSLCSFSYAQDYNEKDIINVVDYKINQVKNNLGDDLEMLQVKLNKLQSTQNTQELQQEIININNSIENIKNNIAQSSITNNTFHKKFRQYDSLVNSNENLKYWFILFAIVLFGFYLFVKYYFLKLQEDMYQQTQEVFKEKFEEYKKEFDIKKKEGKSKKNLK